MKERIEFPVDKHVYRFTPLNAITSFHVARKVTPLLTGMLPALMQDAGGMSGLSRIKAADFERLGPDILSRISQGFAELPDAQADFIISTCLTAIERREEKGWVRIWHASSKVLQFEDIDDMRTMLALVVKVLEPILSDFMAGLPSTLPDGQAEPAPTTE